MKWSGLAHEMHILGCITGGTKDSSRVASAAFSGMAVNWSRYKRIAGGTCAGTGVVVNAVLSLIVTGDPEIEARPGGTFDADNDHTVETFPYALTALNARRAALTQVRKPIKLSFHITYGGELRFTVS